MRQKASTAMKQLRNFPDIDLEVKCLPPTDFQLNFEIHTAAAL